MKFRSVAPAVSIAIALLAAGCGGGDSDPAPTPAPPPSAPAPSPTGSPVASNSCEAFPSGAGAPVTGSLAGKASSPAGRALTFAVLTQPQNGTVTLTSAGAFTYTRTGLSRGDLDSFTYRVTDSEGLTAQATAQILYGRRRIMPMGDSITEGLETDDGTGNSGPPESLRVGYRKALYDRLTAEGYAVQFVGSRNHGSATGLPYPQHEGTSGITQSGLRNAIAGGLQGNPDVVLLHIGTNDVHGSGSIDAAPTAGAVNSILSTIGNFAGNAANPPVRLLLATLIGEKPANPKTDLFNQNLTSLYNANWADPAGTRPRFVVRRVDMNSRFNPTTDIADPPADIGLHPNATGYAKMADAWFDFLIQNDAVAKCP
jgi:lysophospholipase L1-like esterase